MDRIGLVSMREWRDVLAVSEEALWVGARARQIAKVHVVASLEYLANPIQVMQIRRDLAFD